MICKKALSAVDRSLDCALVAVSSLYRTEPVDYEDQAWFLNGAACVETNLEPRKFLGFLKKLEQDAGRKNTGPRFGPRVLDMDILFFNDTRLNEAGLEIPHPRLHKRRFVLVPLCDIASRLEHPVLGKTMDTLLAELDDGEKEVIPWA